MQLIIFFYAQIMELCINYEIAYKITHYMYCLLCHLKMIWQCRLPIRLTNILIFKRKKNSIEVYDSSTVFYLPTTSAKGFFFARNSSRILLRAGLGAGPRLSRGIEAPAGIPLARRFPGQRSPTPPPIPVAVWRIGGQRTARADQWQIN